MAEKLPLPHRAGSQHGSDATVVCSKDRGKTWEPELNGIQAGLVAEQWNEEKRIWLTTEEQRKNFKGWKPMFPGADFGGPSFVQFGKDNQDAIDGYSSNQPSGNIPVFAVNRP